MTKRKRKNEVTEVPPMCPRCGCKAFNRVALYTSFKTIRTEKLALGCVECGLAFDGRKWWADGQEWTMAESGT